MCIAQGDAQLPYEVSQVFISHTAIAWLGDG